MAATVLSAPEPVLAPMYSPEKTSSSPLRVYCELWGVWTVVSLPTALVKGGTLRRHKAKRES